MLKQAVGCEPPVSALASIKLTVLSSKREQQLEVIRNHLDLMRGGFVMMQSEGVLLHFSFCKTESLRDLSQQPLAGLSAQLRRVRQYSAEYDIWDRRGKTQELLQGISPERVVARLCRPWLRVDQSADVLEVGANVGRPNQELVLEGKVFCEVLHRTDQVFRSPLDRPQLRHQVAFVIESDSEVGIAVNHGGSRQWSSRSG